MDLDQDGDIDILSGSYSRQSADMAGLLQVLHGDGKGGFSPPEVLLADDGEPLIIGNSEVEDDGGDVERICTRAAAGDLDGDGDLDLVVGNFEGTFYFVEGLGKGRFSATSRKLQAEGKPLSVSGHGDPFLFDWDGDGDLDILSGSASGDVFLFENRGDVHTPRFAKAKLLLKSAQPKVVDGVVFGEDAITGPQSSTRVWAGDINGDGKPDLLIGDMFTLTWPAKGLSEEVSRERYSKWADKLRALVESGETSGEAIDAHYERMKEIVRQEMTGGVWILYQR